MLACLAVAAVALAVGCSSRDARRNETPRAGAGDANLTLYVSNQSFARPAVDVRVEIDGDVVVSDEFDVDDQHNWVEFSVPLASGSHVISATSETGEAELRRTFRVEGERWAVLDYWCCDDARDPRFTFRVSKRPIVFA